MCTLVDYTTDCLVWFVVFQCDGRTLAPLEYPHPCYLVYPVHGNDRHVSHVTKLLDFFLKDVRQPPSHQERTC